MRIKRFFLSRTTVLSLICIIFLAVLVGALVPQRLITSEPEMFKWKAEHPWLAPWVGRLGLDHVFTTPWFAAFLSLAFVSLSLSSIEQYRAARTKTFKTATAPAGEGVHVGMAEEGLVRALKRRGYLLTARDGVLRFIKHPWGYWGNFLLHVGMVITIAASLFIALTQKRASLNMVEERIYRPGEPWLDEEYGLLAGKLVLPDAVRIDRVRAEFWPNNKVEQIQSDVSFFPEKGAPIRRTVGVSEKLSYGGLIVYQSTSFGDTFHLVFTDDSGKSSVLMVQMLHPQSLDKMTYRDLHLFWMPYLLQAAYFVDAEHESIQSDNPKLFLRLKRGEEAIGPIPLKVGESGELGPYNVRLVRVIKWSGLLFVDISGMPFIFLGFFVIVLGSSLGYFTPPRELVAVKTGGGHVLYWKAGKFKDFYAEEYNNIAKSLKQGKADG